MDHYICHYGIKGMHWGVRRVQNGKSHSSRSRSSRRKKAIRIGAAALGVTAIAGTAYAVKKNPSLAKDLKDSARRYRTAHNNRAVELYTDEKALNRNIKRQRARDARRRAPKDFYDKRMAGMYGRKSNRANRRYEKNAHFSSYEQNIKRKAKLDWNAKVAQEKAELYLRKSNNHKARYNSPYR